MQAARLTMAHKNPLVELKRTSQKLLPVADRPLDVTTQVVERAKF
jgi:hypothetical protein